jgi:predicted small lipoprotein YifL
MRLICLTLVAVFLLAGCGKKGALYLPTSTQPVATQPPSEK